MPPLPGNLKNQKAILDIGKTRQKSMCTAS